MQSVGGAQLFHLRLIIFDLERRLKSARVHRKRYNHSALHNAATRVGAISIGCICQGSPQSVAPCNACRAKELSFGNHHANKCCFS